jgi:hypothetical protein
MTIIVTCNSVIQMLGVLSYCVGTYEDTLEFTSTGLIVEIRTENRWDQMVTDLLNLGLTVTV